MHMGNPLIRGQFEVVSYTEENLKEYKKCAKDFFYFCEKYCYIISDGKRKLFQPRPYQKELIADIIQNRFICAKWPRQSGKSTIVSAYIAWLTIFHELHNTMIAAHVHKTAIEIMDKVKEIIENLPMWLQEGVVKFNQLELEFENGSRVISSATTKNAARGYSYQFVLLDEYAFVEPATASAFFTSVFPTLTASSQGKMAVISTPDGINHFYKFCEEARKGISPFKYSEIHWSDVPGRDEKFKQDTIAALGSIAKWNQEFECSFLGSDLTLIEPHVLEHLDTLDPIQTFENGNLKIFKPPMIDHNYMITVDVSRGVGIDASAFVVFDITQYGIDIVCTYADSKINPLIYPSIINRMGRYYNDACVLVEVNDNGQQVADILFDEYEYENLLGCKSDQGRKGQVLTTFGVKSKGLKQSTASKRIGCENLRTLIEMDKIHINSLDIIAELSVFESNGSTFEAKSGSHDDLVMCLVMMAWCTQQKYFKEYIEAGTREIYSDKIEEMERDMMPLGFRISGDEDPFQEDDIYL